MIRNSKWRFKSSYWRWKEIYRSIVTKYSEAYELSWKPHRGLSSTSQLQSETRQWLIALQTGRKLEMTIQRCEMQVKWFQLYSFESCFTVLIGIEATSVCVGDYTLTWRMSSLWLYGLYTHICNMQALVRNQTRDEQNVWQINLRRILCGNVI